MTGLRRSRPSLLAPRTRARWAALGALAVLAAAHADQYRSEVRELPGTPPPPPPVDVQKLLDATTDPYARALLLRDLAGQAAARGEYGEAAKYLEEAIGQKSLSGIALGQMEKDLAQLLVASGKPEAVIKALERSVKNNPRAPAEQQAALGGAYLQLKRPAEALPLLQRAVAAAQRPEESWLQALYAALMELGRPKEAVPVLEKLVRVNPGRREYWMQLASLHVQGGDKAKALAVLELASRQGHLESAEERLQLVALTAGLGAPFEAASLMQTWMSRDQIPKSAQNWEALAGLWLDAKEGALAAQALNETLALAPKADLYPQLGQLHLNQGDYGAAAQALEQAVQKGERSAATLLALGMSYVQDANLEAATKVFEQAQRLGTARDSAAQWLAYLESDAARAPVRPPPPRPAPPAAVALSSRLTGQPVTVQPALLEAARTAPDLRRVGGRLTPVGAERDASADGTIPEWDGGLLQARWPSAFEPGQKPVDPYPDDRPLFVITAANAARYAGYLTNSHKALLATHPTYQMPVYPTRRSVAFPQAIYDATQANIGKARLVGSDALSGAKLGFPFPMPQNGVEAMWNHRVRYRGNSVEATYAEAVVSDRGVTNLQQAIYRVYFRYGNVESPVDIGKENILLYGVTWLGKDVRQPPDFLVLFHETANSIEKARGIWALLGSARRMFRIPPVGYDQPLFGSEGLYFIDMIDMYNGAFDRYVWKLVGKQELIVPYNSFRLNDGRYRNAQLLTHPHFNQEGARYERHRVWVIEATEREGKRHSFGKRVFYVDEDSWNVLLVENHDHQGRLWRFQEGHLLPFYGTGNANTFPIVTYDLKEGRYHAQRLLSENPAPQFNIAMDSREFLPANVKNKYAR